MELTERSADLGTALLVTDMLLILLTETLHGTENRKGCTLAKTAKSHTLNHGCKLFQLIKIGHFTSALYDFLQNLQHSLGALTARNALAAALPLGKAHEETGNLYHTGILVHNNQSAGAHNGIQLLHGIKIKRRIQLILDQTSAGRTTDLYTLKCSTTLKTAADIIDDLTERGSHRHFNKACVLNRSCKGECLGTRASLCSDGTEPVGTLYNDLRNICIGLYVIQDGWLAPQTLLNCTRRLHTGHTSVSFNG